MEKETLGKTGLEVTRVGLGCAAIGGLYGDIPDEQAYAVVSRALSLGMNLFDTAPLYGYGKSEMRLGKALAGVPRERFVLATKVGRLLVPKEMGSTEQDGQWGNPPPVRPRFDFSYDAVMRSFEESLKRLNVDRIDILHIHDPDNHYDQAIRGAYSALDKLRSQRLIRGVSAGMNQSEMLARFAREGDFDCFLLAGRYSLLEQGALDELFPLCAKKNIGIMLGGTYNSGILAKELKPGAKYNYADAPPEILEKARGLQALASRYNVSLKAAASQFALAHPVVTTIIPGTRVPERVDENLNVLRERIPSEFWAELKAKKLIRPDAPVPNV
ncbi:MAG: aldo/keto reductase [Acidobacteria bacterium]|nr:MAG: aldo/keto reductase [Acidobacteriota bacterium]